MHDGWRYMRKELLCLGVHFSKRILSPISECTEFVSTSKVKQKRARLVLA